ncbi:uncharacterized protein LOC115269042 [Aedes albopictus]|uniref:Uncharacterized protein n=1 Tax=Aedes albopictus TaxID=7160 RepID=A0ABM2A0C6_AEDAL|nr:uncharacterized protein LOC115269042 [Aedes albopictus]
MDRENANRHAKVSEIDIGDTVLMQNLTPGNKLSTTYGPAEYTVLSKEGSRMTVQNESTGKIFQRNSAHLKKISLPVQGEQGEGSVVSSPPQIQPVPEGQQSTDASVSPMEMNNDQSDGTANSDTRPKRAVRRPLRFDDYVEDYNG